MDDSRATDGVEHLQAAARELLSAARAFLDVIEDVVEDSDRLEGAAATISDLVRTGFSRRGTQPWADAAWDVDAPDPEDRDGDDLDDLYGDDLSAEDLDGEMDGVPAGDRQSRNDSADDGPSAGGSGDQAATRPSGSSRVRRIAVD